MALVAVACATVYVEGLQYSVPIFGLLLAIMSLVYLKIRRNFMVNSIAQLKTNPESSPAER